METAGPKRAEEKVNPGSSHGAGSVEGRVSVCLGLVSLVGDEEFKQEASCRELAWGLSVDSSFRSFIGGKREKKWPFILFQVLGQLRVSLEAESSGGKRATERWEGKESCSF